MRATAAETAAAHEVLKGIAILVGDWMVERRGKSPLFAIRLTVRRVSADASRDARTAGSVAAGLRAGLRLWFPNVDLGRAGIAGRRVWMPVLGGASMDHVRGVLESYLVRR